MRLALPALLLSAAFLSALTGRAGPGDTDRPAEKPDVDKLNKKIAFSLVTPDGKTFDSAAIKGKKAIVVVFLSFDCPVSNGYAPTLIDLSKRFADKGVAFVAVNASDDLSAKEVAKKAREFELPFPVLRDERFQAADAFHAKIAPEVFVLDHNHVLRYRGRVDNAYSARLKRNRQVTSHDLKNALDDLLAGKAPREPATRAIGCPIQRGEKAVATAKVTYYKDVLPVLQANCQGCHRPGEVGPFSLMTYKQAKSWAQDIKEYTRDRRMPPWKPVSGLAFHNERKLSDRDIATLAAWADGGTPEGDVKDAPKSRAYTEGWQLGEPDLVLTVSEDMVVGPSGKDLFRCFVLPTGLTEDRHVVAVEVRPGNKRVVHHTLNFFDSSGQARKLEAKERNAAKKGAPDHGPGYSVAMGVGFRGEAGKFGGLGGWAPGQRARYLPEGYGYPLPKGSDVVVQVHYHRTGRTEKDRTRIGLYFAKKPGVRPWKAFVLQGQFLWVPAGASSYKVRGAVEVQEDCDLHSVMPHMHMLGKEIKVTMTSPGGGPVTLLNITDWDYNWQESYFLKKPLAVTKGTRFEVDAVYDNSDSNPNNPFSPPRRVWFGEQTDDEMCFVFFGATSNGAGRGIAVKRLTPPAKK